MTYNLFYLFSSQWVPLSSLNVRSFSLSYCNLFCPDFVVLVFCLVLVLSCLAVISWGPALFWGERSWSWSGSWGGGNWVAVLWGMQGGDTVSERTYFLKNEKLNEWKFQNLYSIPGVIHHKTWKTLRFCSLCLICLYTSLVPVGVWIHAL